MASSETNANQPEKANDPPASPAEGEAGDLASGNKHTGGQPTGSEAETAGGGADSTENKTGTRRESSLSGLSVVSSPIENLQSLPSVLVGVEEKPDVKEPSLPIIGFNLSSFVLFIISGFILFLAIYLSTQQFEASSLIQVPTETNISDSTYARKIELIRMIQEEKKSYREFTVQMSQMVLLNLLLPVLTAILGYIFASNKNSSGT